jgi:hypothetical protein
MAVDRHMRSRAQAQSAAYRVARNAAMCMLTVFSTYQKFYRQIVKCKQQK